MGTSSYSVISIRSFLAAAAAAAFTLLALFSSPALANGGDCDSRVFESSADPYWSSYPDYRERLLTVEETVQNAGGCGSCYLRITDIQASGGVMPVTGFPVDLGEVPLAKSRSFDIKYRVPEGVRRFRTTVRAVCTTQPPADEAKAVIDPSFALSNEGCPAPPLPEFEDRPVPGDTSYGPRRFTVTLTREDGTPIPGAAVKWDLSSPVSFRILESSGVTDGNGQAYAVVTPPQYFVCIIPYYSRDWTLVSARTSAGAEASAIFAYSRCLPYGSVPPWARDLTSPDGSGPAAG